MNSPKIKIFLYVPDGTGVRNYLYSNTFRQKGNVEVSLLHDFAPDIEKLILDEVDFFASVKLPKFIEGKREKFLREQSHIARLYFFAKKLDNKTLLDAYKSPTSGLLKKTFYRAIELAARRTDTYESIRDVDEKYRRIIKMNPFYLALKTLFKDHKPDVIFLTHQRAIQAPYVFEAARTLGIKTVSVIFSWDNLPKARLYIAADQYFVWSEHMKSELAQFYPEINQEKVIVTGTPQFEFYKDVSDIEDRTTFAASYGLDPLKKWICFSGDDMRTSPYDPKYLEDLAEEIEGSRFRESVQIIFRRCPVDYSGRYNSVIEKYTHIIKEVPPEWLEAKLWTMVIPKKSDLTLLKNTVHHCEAVINVGSTMAFDFAQYNKPAIYINYDVPNAKGWSVNTVYNFQHFKSMSSSNSVIWWNDKEEIPAIVEKVLNKKYDMTAMNHWFNKIVSPSYVPSQKILKTLLN